MEALFQEFSIGNSMTTAIAGLVLLPMVYYVVIFAAFVRRSRRIGNVLDKFPGPPKHWMTGTLHLIPRQREKELAVFRELVKEYPRVIRFWLGPFICNLNVMHPDPIKTVLRSTEPKQMGLGPGYQMLQSWLGEGLLLASGKKWQRNRRLLTPAFHFDVLKPYMKISNEAADILVEKFAVASKSGASVEICKPICLCALNVILRCAFSYDEDVQQKGESHPYVNAVLTMAKLLADRFIKPSVYLDYIYNLTFSGRLYQRKVAFVHEVSKGIIATRQKTLRENPDAIRGNKHPDFLDILLLAKDEEDKGLTDTEINNEVDTFLFEGHDTTASAISWILYELARYPEHQEQCRQEVDRLLDGRTDTEILWDDLQEIPYLNMCVKEAMRLNSPVPLIGRETSRDFELEGIVCPKGTSIVISVNQLHTNRAVWGDDALEFKPDRFHHDRMKNMDPYAFVPFSAGPRNCIGQNFAMHEIKVVVAKVIYRFELRLDPDHKVDHVLELVMRAKNGINVFFTPRV